MEDKKVTTMGIRMPITPEEEGELLISSLLQIATIALTRLSRYFATRKGNR